MAFGGGVGGGNPGGGGGRSERKLPFNLMIDHFTSTESPHPTVRQASKQ